ncbi:MAG: chemotaxis protein CheW [Desulfovibrionaceae bacterium]
MVKTPEEYFQNLELSPVAVASDAGLTDAEQAFVSKYMGIEGAKDLGLDLATQKQENTRDIPITSALQDELKTESSIQMVSFYLDSQIYTIPIVTVQEVIRFISPTLLPMAPPFVAGVINLRGRVTPLLYLDQLVTNTSRQHGDEKFIIICTRKGLQVGLIIDKVHSMYFVRQEQIIWNIESQIGASAEYLCGLVDIDDKIFGIVSIDMIVDQVLQS